MSQVFYRKWRPQTFTDVVGQEPITQTLRNALRSGRISHAYLFCGPRGTGKTSTGRILAKAINCLNSQDGEPCNVCEMCLSITEGRAMDVIEIDAASNTGVDDIRQLREKVNYSPNQAKYKVYIIDEVHMLSNSASNALLKTLEEPPAHVIFILATTEAHKILPTILSRCQCFDFRRLSLSDVVSKLSEIAEKEGITAEPEAVRLIARSATGSLRDAENMLQQLTTYYGNQVSLKQVQSTLGITGDSRARELVKHIINRDISAGITLINSVNTDGLDLRQFNREMVGYLRALLLLKTGSADAVDLSTEDIADLKELITKTSLEDITRAARHFSTLEFGFESHSSLPLELALVDSVLAPREAPKAEPRHEPAEKAAPPARTAPEKPGMRSRTNGTNHSPSANHVPAKPSVPVAAVKKPAGTPPYAPLPPQPKPAAPPRETPLTVPPKLEAATPIEKLKIYWNEVVAQAPTEFRKTNAVAFLRSGKPLNIEPDNTVCLEFKYSFHKEKMENSENKPIAEKIISSFLGGEYHIRCILEEQPSGKKKPSEIKEDSPLVREALGKGAVKIESDDE